MTQILKRDGRIVPFQHEKIVTAIENAMSETVNGIDEELSIEIADEVETALEESDIIFGVEEIQDYIEELMMNSPRKDAARSYILYREKRKYVRKTKTIPGALLSDDFLSPYKHKPNPMSQLGSFVYYRTYSRWLPEENRREYWWETVRRAVEYNCSLAPTTVNEAQELFHNIFHLKQFLSGRTFWTGGTDVSKHYPMGNYNCAFSVIDNFDAFKDLFYLLMVGVGFGVRILKSDVVKLPPIRTDIITIHESYRPVARSMRQETTSLEFSSNNIARITVGDSKEGWTQAMDYYFKIHYSFEYRKIDSLIINYDSVRPKGERLKTFGGTASGHDALKDIIFKIDRILKKNRNGKLKLRPIHCLDFANIIGEGVVVGGVRRTAEIALIDANDIECINAKSNLYKQVDGQWIVDQSIIHRQMSNNSIYYQEKPTKEQLHWQIEQMRYSGEPAFINEIAAAKRRENFKGVNPCFAGDMRLLTSEGYQTFEELCDQEVKIININGEATDGKVWMSGIKNTVDLNLSNGETIRCTPDHVFMTLSETEVQAKNLKGQCIMPYTGDHKIFLKDFVKMGFIQGDGNLVRLKSATHKSIEVNIGKKDQDLLYLFHEDKFSVNKNRRSIYLSGYNEMMKRLRFDASVLPERKFPGTYNEWTYEQKSSFLHGCYSANGSVITNHRVSYKTTSGEFAQKLKESLIEDFEINAYITTNMAKNVEFENGTYLCKESYDVNISNYKGLQKFATDIGFYQLYKKIKLRNLLKHKAPYVRTITPGEKIKVYDFEEPKTHWGVVEGFIAHNCAEILLDSRGLCNLTTINVFAFVKDDKTLDTESLLRAQELSVRAAYRMTCVDLELPMWNNVQKHDKLLGCSLTGWQDAVNALGLKKEDQIFLLNAMRDSARKEADLYATQIGENKPILITTVKPEGTLSQLPTVSSGMHYSHSPYYIRRVRISSQDPLVKVCEELGYPVFPEAGQDIKTCVTKIVEFPVKAPDGKTKYDVSAIEQLDDYLFFMKHYVDHNASITVHVREHEWELVEQWMWDNWNDVVAVSFLSLDESFYKMLPYESITKEEYETRKAAMKEFVPSLISKYEQIETEIDAGIESCESGVCPIR